MSATTQTVSVAKNQSRPKQHLIRTLGGSLREYKKDSLLAPAFVAVESVLEILIPTVMASLIDQGISGGSMPAIIKFGVILLLCAVVSLGAGFLSGKFAAIAGAGFAKNLRQDQFKKVQGFSFTNIDRFSTGSIVTRLTTDVTNLQNAYMMMIRMGVRAPIMVIVAWIFAFRISPSISLVFLACIPILAIGLCGLAVLVHPVFERVFHTYDALNNVVDENLQGIRVVKSYNRESFEVSKFGRISERIFKDFTKAERIMSFNSPLMMVCVYASMILIAWMGAQQIVASGNNPAVGLTTGDLTALVTYAMQILSSLMMLSMVFAMLTISLSSARRIAEVIEEKTDIQNPEHPIMAVRDGAIDFDHVSFVYASKADKKVLDDIDLHIRSGETIGVIGGTGSGKSTLINLIPRFYDCTSGSVELFGHAVQQYGFAQLRQMIGIVPQRAVLFTGTIRDNMQWACPDATDEQIWQALEIAQAADFVRGKPKGLDEPVETAGRNFSGGQRQRLAMARALLYDTPIYLFDEATSNVDAESENDIMQAIHSLAGKKTIILISHRLANVVHSDCIYAMSNGRVIEQGTHAELLAKQGAYSRLYLAQRQLETLEEEDA